MINSQETLSKGQSNNCVFLNHLEIVREIKFKVILLTSNKGEKKNCFFLATSKGKNFGKFRKIDRLLEGNEPLDVLHEVHLQRLLQLFAKLYFWNPNPVTVNRMPFAPMIAHGCLKINLIIE